MIKEILPLLILTSLARSEDKDVPSFQDISDFTPNEANRSPSEDSLVFQDQVDDTIRNVFFETLSKHGMFPFERNTAEFDTLYSNDFSLIPTTAVETSMAQTEVPDVDTYSIIDRQATLITYTPSAVSITPILTDTKHNLEDTTVSSSLIADNIETTLETLIPSTVPLIPTLTEVVYNTDDTTLLSSLIADNVQMTLVTETLSEFSLTPSLTETVSTIEGTILPTSLIVDNVHSTFITETLSAFSLPQTLTETEINIEDRTLPSLLIPDNIQATLVTETSSVFSLPQTLTETEINIEDRTLPSLLIPDNIQATMVTETPSAFSIPQTLTETKINIEDRTLPSFLIADNIQATFITETPSAFSLIPTLTEIVNSIEDTTLPSSLISDNIQTTLVTETPSALSLIQTVTETVFNTQDIILSSSLIGDEEIYGTHDISSSESIKSLSSSVEFLSESSLSTPLLQTTLFQESEILPSTTILPTLSSEVNSEQLSLTTSSRSLELIQNDKSETPSSVLPSKTELPFASSLVSPWFYNPSRSTTTYSTNRYRITPSNQLKLRYITLSDSRFPAGTQFSENVSTPKSSTESSNNENKRNIKRANGRGLRTRYRERGLHINSC